MFEVLFSTAAATATTMMVVAAEREKRVGIKVLFHHLSVLLFYFDGIQLGNMKTLEAAKISESREEASHGPTSYDLVSLLLRRRLSLSTSTSSTSTETKKAKPNSLVPLPAPALKPHPIPISPQSPRASSPAPRRSPARPCSSSA